jgi:hypothetical protein
MDGAACSFYETIDGRGRKGVVYRWTRLQMTRYTPARHYLTFGIVAVGLAGFSAWLGRDWVPAFIPAGLFLLTGVLLLALAFRPALEIHEGYLGVGKRIVPWMDIRRLDRTGWVSPLIVRLTLFDDTRMFLIYPGDVDSCNSLSRHLCRLSRDAVIDGKPYRQYWGEILAPGGDRRQMQAPRYRMLLPEDEAEVEWLYQRLKTVGHLDQKKSADEK